MQIVWQVLEGKHVRSVVSLTVLWWSHLLSLSSELLHLHAVSKLPTLCIAAVYMSLCVAVQVSLAKPLFTALSGGSRSSREYRQYSLTGATAAAGAAAAAAGDQPEQGLGVADTGAAGSATDNVDDMGSGSPACDVSAAGDSAADVAAASDMSVLLGREGDDAGFDKL